MADNLTYQDGSYTTAFEISLPEFATLVPNSTEKDILTSKWCQELTSFAALALGTAHPDYANYKLVEEGPLQDIGGGKVVWQRTYMKKPVDYDDFNGTFAFTFPGFSGVMPDGSGTVGTGGSAVARLPYSITVPRKTEVKFYFTTNPNTDITILQKFQPTLGGANTKIDFVGDANAANPATSPSRTAYDALIAGGTYIVAEATSWERVRGNLFRSQTVYVKAQ